MYWLVLQRGWRVIINLVSGCVFGKVSYLVRNMRAGSMLTEAMRPTWRISLAIILSFSKFTRPSTLESFPEKQRKKIKWIQITHYVTQLTKLIQIRRAAINTYYYYYPTKPGLQMWFKLKDNLRFVRYTMRKIIMAKKRTPKKEKVIQKVVFINMCDLICLLWKKV